jgi:hypothetical protein
LGVRAIDSRRAAESSCAVVGATSSRARSRSSASVEDRRVLSSASDAFAVS